METNERNLEAEEPLRVEKGYFRVFNLLFETRVLSAFDLAGVPYSDKWPLEAVGGPSKKQKGTFR